METKPIEFALRRGPCPTAARLRRERRDADAPTQRDPLALLRRVAAEAAREARGGFTAAGLPHAVD